MSASCLKPSARRWKPVRLGDVPEPVRLRGAHLAASWCDDPDEALKILLLALRPPKELVAWIAP